MWFIKQKCSAVKYYNSKGKTEQGYTIFSVTISVRKLKYSALYLRVGFKSKSQVCALCIWFLRYVMAYWFLFLHNSTWSVYD